MRLLSRGTRPSGAVVGVMATVSTWQASADNPGGSTQLARLDPRSGTVLQVRQLTGLAAVSYEDVREPLDAGGQGTDL